ncbi:MAG: asparagine synthase (glutamine-hydrolyzing) [Betaproteobacteria bacterium]|nr:asparagine synthase (glutamine-hydrolyzing) [Betaproteobacteria bacterium]
MCGIAGLFDATGRRPPQRHELEAMAAAIAHRGPDGRGFHLAGPVGLGHARLSIIDLATGDQPIFNEDRSVVVVCNGEIFNYRELTADLRARGHRFRTQSDCEVLVHLYEERGEDLVGSLNGQFAFALWDRRRARLLLARDRVGIRPLVYTESGGRFAFASEVRALFALPEVQRAIDPAALADVATCWSPLPPRTAFTDIHALGPGEWLSVDAGGSRRRTYWDWDFAPAATASMVVESRQVDDLRERLVASVGLQLRADVPVGAYLSGGLDSAIVASIVRHRFEVPLRTFSLTFEDPEFDESAHQARMHAALGGEHTAIRCTRADIRAHFPRAVRHAEVPIVRTAPVPLMLLAAHVRDCGYKVVLTGEGADEVFAGYDLFKEAKVRRFMAAQPGSVQRPRLLERLYGYIENAPTRGPLAAAFFRQGLEHADAPDFAHATRWTTTQRVQRFFSRELRDRLGGYDPRRTIAASLPEAIDRWPALGRYQYLEAHTLLSGYLLCSQGDRMAMAHSVEGRMPFLDHTLIEFANGLAPQRKLFGLREKHLLKKAAAPFLPADVVARVKQPYRAPDSASFFESGLAAPWVRDVLSPASLADAGLFDQSMVERLVAKCAGGRAIGFADNMAFVTVLSTMLLHRQLVRGEHFDGA